MTDMAGDDWAHVFTEKELAELDEMFGEILLQVEPDLDDDGGPTEFLQVTMLAPIGNIVPLVTEIYNTMHETKLEDNIESFLMMLARGCLWQYKQECPDGPQVDDDVEQFFMEDWDADEDDSIEFG